MSTKEREETSVSSGIRRSGLVRFPAVALMGLLLLLGQEVVVAAAQTPSQVVLYTGRNLAGTEDLFASFTARTGIAVTIEQANANAIFERLQSEGPATTADLFLTTDAGNLSNAAEAGLLSTVASPTLWANIPAHLRDSANRWFGLTVRVRTIMYNTERVNPSEIPSYASLGDPKWRGRICLRTSTNMYNQVLLGAAILQDGEGAAERMVRRWVANRPTYIDSDTQILQAVATGTCDLGVTNSYDAARQVQNAQLPIRPMWVDQDGGGAHVNIAGAGVTAHAKNRDGAIRLLEFLSTREAQEVLAATAFEYPANPAAQPMPILAGWGSFKQQTVGVARAAEQRADGLELAERAGYQ